MLESAVAYPDAPQPQFAMGGSQAQQPAPAQPTTAPAAPGSSSSQTPAGEPGAEKTQRQKADAQIKDQEKQRVFGFLPSFNTSYQSDAVSMTRTQKMSLAFHSSIDPVAFAISFVVAGVHEASDSDPGTDGHPGFGWGPEGYFKRSGAAYLDAFDGAMIGNGILPSILHQDPRYFRRGHGSAMHRIFYSAATSFICKHDNSGRWEPNYSNVAGNIISGAISNLYYPSQNSGVGQTISNGMIVTAEGAFGAELNEFWPDISRKWFHKDPTRGLDAQVKAADDAKKKQPLAPQK